MRSVRRDRGSGFESLGEFIPLPAGCRQLLLLLVDLLLDTLQPLSCCIELLFEINADLFLEIDIAMSPSELFPQLPQFGRQPVNPGLGLGQQFSCDT